MVPRKRPCYLSTYTLYLPGCPQHGLSNTGCFVRRKSVVFSSYNSNVDDYSGPKVSRVQQACFKTSQTLTSNITSRHSHLVNNAWGNEDTS